MGPIALEWGLDYENLISNVSMEANHPAFDGPIKDHGGRGRAIKNHGGGRGGHYESWGRGWGH